MLSTSTVPPVLSKPNSETNKLQDLINSRSRGTKLTSDQRNYNKPYPQLVAKLSAEVTVKRVKNTNQPLFQLKTRNSITLNFGSTGRDCRPQVYTHPHTKHTRVRELCARFRKFRHLLGIFVRTYKSSTKLSSLIANL